MSPHSLILVTVDCLRADHVGFLGYSRPTTPFLDSLASESFVVPIAIVGGVPTYYSLPAILASRSPLAFGRDIIGIAPAEITLASHLQSCEFTTACFLAANPYLSRRFGYDQAFDHYRDYLDQHSSAERTLQTAPPNEFLRTVNERVERLSAHWGVARSIYNELYFRYCQFVAPSPMSLDSVRPYPDAATLVSAACEWLATTSEKRFFLWLHFMDPHAPYYPPDAALHEISGKQLSPGHARYLNAYWNRGDLSINRLGTRREAIRELYDAGIRWVDTQLARLTDTLRSMGVWDRCVFTVTADHGEEFLEHGGRFHVPSAMKEELIRVPLMVRTPGRPGKMVSRTPFSHLDLAPTLLDSLELPIPAQFRGCSRWQEWLNGDTRDRVVIVDSAECKNPFQSSARIAARVLCVRGERYKMVLRFSSGAVELFDLQEDPREQKPLPHDAEPGVRRRFLEHARDYLERINTPDHFEKQLQARLSELSWKLAEADAVHQ